MTTSRELDVGTQHASITWTESGILARTSATTVRRLLPTRGEVIDYAIAPDTKAFAFDIERGLVTSDGFVVRSGDRMTPFLAAARCDDPRIIEHCLFSDSARVIAVTWTTSGNGWVPYDAFGLFDTLTGNPLPCERMLPDEWCDGEIAFAGVHALLAHRTYWYASNSGSAGGPGRGFDVWNVESGRRVGGCSDCGMGDVNDNAPCVYAIDRSGAYVAYAQEFPFVCGTRFDVRREEPEFDIASAIDGFIARRGSVAVCGNGQLVIACRDRIVFAWHDGQTAVLPAESPLAVALSRDETHVAWLEASGAVRTAAIPTGGHSDG